MIVFKTVVAELSTDLLTLIPDPLVADQDFQECDRKEYQQHEVCQPKLLHFTLQHPPGEDVCHKGPDSGRLSLSPLNLDNIALSKDFCYIQLRIRYLNSKMKPLFPNAQIRWSKFDDGETLQFHGSWETMISIHEWLENFFKDLAPDYDSKDFDHDVNVVKEPEKGNEDIAHSPQRSSVNEDGRRQEDNQTELYANNNCSPTKLQSAEETSNRDVAFDNYLKEELNVSSSCSDEILASLNDLQMPNNKMKNIVMFSCNFCSFQATTRNAIKVHEINLHGSKSILEQQQHVKVSSRLTARQRINKQKRCNLQQIPPRATFMVEENPQSISIRDDFVKSQTPSHGRDNLFDLRDEKPTYEEVLYQLSAGLTDKPDIPERLHKPLKEQSLCTANSNGHHLKSAVRDAGASGSGPVFGCDLCDFLTSKQRNLVFHRVRVHGERHLSCSVCSKQFAIQKDLNQHLRFHTEHYCCDQCGKTLRSKYALTLHISVVHEKMQPKPVQSYLCNLCGRLCRSKTDYTVHCNKEHLGIHPHACKVCGMRFFAKANLKVHLQTHGESRDFVCTECGKTFRQRQGLRVHLNIHKTEKPYQCPVCEKTFTQRGALVRHARTHTAERPYACKLCSSTFNDYSILRRHMLGIHKIEDTTVLRKTVKEACAEARDVERSRLTGQGQCKAESSGFDMANTLIALSQQYQEQSLNSGVSNTESSHLSKEKNSFESRALVRGLNSAESFSVLSLPEVVVDQKQNSTSPSPIICLISSNVEASSAKQAANPSGAFSFPSSVVDIVHYISLPDDHTSLTTLAQHPDELQRSGT